MRVRTPIIAVLGIVGFVGCVVETTPQNGRPNPNSGAGGSVPGTGGSVPGTGGTGVPGAGGTGLPGTGGTGLPGTGGTGDPGAGGSVPGTGGTGDPGAGGTGTGGTGTQVSCGAPSPDANCTSSLAKTDATCTVDCCIACGYNGLGTKTCTCDPVAHTYSACPCAKPADWQVPATVSTTCADLIGNDGLVDTNDETPCSTQWEACIAADDLVAAGTTTSRGCVCLPDPEAGGALTWSCGSTNKWFTCPVGMSYPGCPPPA